MGRRRGVRGGRCEICADEADERIADCVILQRNNDDLVAFSTIGTGTDGFINYSFMNILSARHTQSLITSR